MGFQQYHEPPQELSQETRTFARMIASLMEEADAINWYEQRLSVENDAAAKAIMADAQGERLSRASSFRKATLWSMARNRKKRASNGALFRNK